MYEQFYGLKDKPFSMLPDPAFLYLSKKHQAALTLLEYGLMNNVGFCVISGETGAGKTTVLRTLLNRIDDSYRVGMITNTHQSFGSLLDWILSAFNQHEKGLSHVEMHQKLMDYLISEYGKNRKILLVVDEAQNMNAETLEELRMLSNVNSEKDQLMQVILAGQPALKDTLRIPELMQFAQRIGVDYHLGDLDVSETTNYIQHRLRTAGATHDIFTAAACARIHSYSGGTPRLVNLLCDTVMVYGFADQLDSIDVDLVDEMVQERMKDSVVPLVNRDSPTVYSEEELEKLENDFPSIKEQIENEVAAKEAMAREDAQLRSATQTDDDADTEVDNPTGSSPELASESVSEAQDDSAHSTVLEKKIVNKVEVIQQKTEKETDHLWLYGIIVVLLLLIVFFVFKSNLMLSDGSSKTPVRAEAHQIVRDKVIDDNQLTQGEVQKQQKALALKTAQQKREKLAAAQLEKNRVEKAHEAAVREQRIAEEQAAKQAKDQANDLADELAAVAEQKRQAEVRKLEASKLEKNRLELKKQQALREQEKAAIVAQQKLETKRIETERLEAKRLEAQMLEAKQLEAERLAAEKLAAEKLAESQRLEELASTKKQKSGWTQPV